MKKFVLALSMLLASSSASAWPYLAVYAPGAIQSVPASPNYGTPAVVNPGHYHGSPVMGYRAPYAYPFLGYVPGQPVRNVMRGALRYYSIN